MSCRFSISSRKMAKMVDMDLDIGASEDLFDTEDN